MYIYIFTFASLCPPILAELQSSVRHCKAPGSQLLVCSSEIQSIPRSTQFTQFARSTNVDSIKRIVDLLTSDTSIICHSAVAAERDMVVYNRTISGILFVVSSVSSGFSKYKISTNETDITIAVVICFFFCLTTALKEAKGRR